MSGGLWVAAAAAAMAVWLWSRPAGHHRSGAGPGGAALPGRTGRGGTVAAKVRRAFTAPRPPPVAELLAALAAELDAGQPIEAALVHAAHGLDPPPCPHALGAARAHGDVAAALRRDARESAAPGLVGLAACWDVAAQSGAGLAAAVSRLADGMRAAEDARAQLASELAAVRGTARMLAGLPVLGLLIGQWIGADPVAWLVGTWPGRAALAGGVGLLVAGNLWLHRMVTSARDAL